MDTESRPVPLHGGKAWQPCKRSDLWCKWEARMQLLRAALSSKNSDSQLLTLINESMELYKISLSSSRSTENLLAALSGKNLSPLEVSFLWLGGWRPSSAITLVFSKMGVEVRSVDGYIESITPSCCLSKIQLSRLEVLLKQTRHAEAELSNELATVQMLLPDQNMAEAIGLGKSAPSPDSIVDGEYLMDTKLATLRNLFAQSNRLRLQTLQQLLNLLTPVQAAQSTIAAFELVFAMKSLGKIATVTSNSDIAQIAPSVKVRNREAKIRKNDGEGLGV